MMLSRYFKPGEVVMVDSGEDEQPILLTEIGEDGFAGIEVYEQNVIWFNIHSSHLRAVRALRENEKKLLKETMEILAERKADAEQISKPEARADDGVSRGDPVSLKLEARI